MSYQARMRMPWFIVTGRTGASGTQKRAGLAMGQSFPARPVRLVVGFTPGGGVDINARLLAAMLTGLLGQQVIVENKPGAGTNIANEYVAKSVPDGYTLLFNSSAFAINLALYQNPPYALRDFAGFSVFF